MRGDAVTAFGRELRVGAFPIGIDVDQFHRYAFTAPGNREFARMQSVLRGRDQFIGVDRLDYSKGLLRRMDAFGRYLESHPKAHGQVILLQVAPVSRGDLTAYRSFRAGTRPRGGARERPLRALRLDARALPQSRRFRAARSPGSIARAAWASSRRCATA